MQQLKLEAKTHNEKLVKEYLENNASEVLADKINNGKKTLQGCWNYITNEARKKAIGGCACIEDREVFGWAIHYFEEDSIKEGEIKSEPVKNPKTDVKPTKTKAKSADGQMSLFDLGATGEKNDNETDADKQ